MERIQKIIANCGYCSRRKAEELIEMGLVRVNGKRAEIGQSAEYGKDRITVEGNVMKKPELEYYILNKPMGYETTMNSPQGRRTAVSLIKTKNRIVPIGRLDMDSRGLLMFTNDGDFANMIMHPRYELAKEYEVTIKGKINPGRLKKLETGIKIKTGRTYPCEIKNYKQGKNATKFSIIIHEGKNRQIRRMIYALGYEILDLVRIRIGNVHLGKLKETRYRKLTEKEINDLKAIIKIGTPRTFEDKQRTK